MRRLGKMFLAFPNALGVKAMPNIGRAKGAGNSTHDPRLRHTGGGVLPGNCAN
jgi:hypothetical protein